MASLKYIVIFFLMMMLVNDGYTEAMEEKLVRAPVKLAAEKDQILLEQGKHPDEKAAENAKFFPIPIPIPLLYK